LRCLTEKNCSVYGIDLRLFWFCCSNHRKFQKKHRKFQKKHIIQLPSTRLDSFQNSNMVKHNTRGDSNRSRHDNISNINRHCVRFSKQHEGVLSTDIVFLYKCTAIQRLRQLKCKKKPRSEYTRELIDEELANTLEFTLQQSIHDHSVACKIIHVLIEAVTRIESQYCSMTKGLFLDPCLEWQTELLPKPSSTLLQLLCDACKK
jgi:hypothetical protein